MQGAQRPPGLGEPVGGHALRLVQQFDGALDVGLVREHRPRRLYLHAQGAEGMGQHVVDLARDAVAFLQGCGPGVLLAQLLSVSQQGGRLLGVGAVNPQETAGKHAEHEDQRVPEHTPGAHAVGQADGGDGDGAGAGDGARGPQAQDGSQPAHGDAGQQAHRAAVGCQRGQPAQDRHGPGRPQQYGPQLGPGRWPPVTCRPKEDGQRRYGEGGAFPHPVPPGDARGIHHGGTYHGERAGSHAEGNGALSRHVPAWPPGCGTAHRLLAVQPKTSNYQSGPVWRGRGWRSTTNAIGTAARAHRSGGWPWYNFGVCASYRKPTRRLTTGPGPGGTLGS